MDFIEWSESMSVGNPLIDQDHKIIIKLINQLHHHVGAEEDRKALASALNTLIDYTLYHFSREERVMMACKYPSFEAHKRQHEKLIEQVVDTAHRFFEKKEDIVQDELLDFLKSWLINHILKQDMGFFPYAENNPEVLGITSSLRTDSEQPDMLGTDDLIPKSVNWNEAAILIVSKSRNFRNIIASILEIADAGEIQQYSHADDAMQSLENHVPNLIVYGWKQDDDEAIPFLEKLREIKSGSFAGIPVLLISAREERGAMESGLIAGATHCIEEPIGIQTFFEAAVKAINQ
ncbi:MAG: bacteriohemerythrin [gamma proteobacterium endosymbiont of Lamellibrachia anaximandri]|nr:bacteriohemerythrin [gamma proteobacterium endosymbiont of Lamellibrachia anaximandri]